MLSDKEKDWLLKKIDKKFPRGKGEPAHPLFQLYKENDKVHDADKRLDSEASARRRLLCHNFLHFPTLSAAPGLFSFLKERLQDIFLFCLLNNSDLY